MPKAIATCGCFGIALTEAQQATIGQQYTGCLCRACLLELQQTIPDDFFPEKNAPESFK